ncbi:MAG: DNA internalization-related competence protein ComEC/Rec2 [bacterium]
MKRLISHVPVLPGIAVAFGAGIVIASRAQPDVYTAVAFALAAALAVIALRNSAVFVPALLCAVVPAGALLYQVDTLISSRPELTRFIESAARSKRAVFVEGSAETTPIVTGKRARFTMSVRLIGADRAHMERRGGKLMVVTNADRDDLPGYADVVRTEGRVSGLGFMSPAEGEHFRTLGVSGFFFVPEYLRMKKTGEAGRFVLFRAGNRAGDVFRRTLFGMISEPESSVLGSMMFGKNVKVPDELWRDFRRAGVVHVLVVSGLHVWMLLGCFLWLSFLWRRSPYVTFAVLSAALLMFYSMTGGGPATLRAVIMGIVYLASLLVRREYDRTNALFGAALFIMILNPRMIFHPGAQFSFIACGGLAFLYPALMGVLPAALKSRWLSPLFISLCATLPLYPVTARHFYEISLASPLTNIVVVPAVGILLPFAFFATCAASLFPAAGTILAPALYLPTKFIIEFTSLTAALPFSSVLTGQPSLPWTAVYFASLWCWWKFLKAAPRERDEVITRYLLAGGMSASLLAWGWLFTPPSGTMSVTFIDVGQGDSILIDAPCGNAGYQRFRVLVDGGGRQGGAGGSSYDPGEKKVGKLLMKRAIRHLDAVVLTHPEEDHMNGLLWVMKNLSVDRWFDTGVQPPVMEKKGGARSNISDGESAVYRDILEIISKNGIERRLAMKGFKFVLDSGVEFRFLYPDEQNFIAGAINTNEVSSVLKITYGQASFLLTGDIEAYGEETIAALSGYDIRSSVVKAPHHGSDTSSSWRFLKLVQPLAGVISCGRLNVYGHPHESVIRRYREIGAHVFRTDMDGDVTILTDGKLLKVYSEFRKRRNLHVALALDDL